MTILSYAIPAFFYALQMYLRNELERLQKKGLFNHQSQFNIL